MRRREYYHVNSAYRAGRIYEETLVKKFGAKAVKQNRLPSKAARFRDSLKRQSHQK